MPMDKSELDSRIFDGFADTSRRKYVYVCNMRTNVSRWSKNAVAEFDLPGEYMEDAASIWVQCIHPDDREKYLKDIEAVFSGVKFRHDLDYRVRNKYGDYVTCTCRGKVIKGEKGAADLFVGTIENHSIMDNVDGITNLYNIYEFWQHMKQLREKDTEAVILLTGINNFDEINGIYGYSFGNKVLREFANRLLVLVKDKGIVFRMDGVQFACCFTGFDKEKTQAVYKEMQRVAKNDIYVDGIRISINISGGAAFFSEEYDENSIQTSLKYALGESKHKYQGMLQFFNDGSLTDNKKNLELMNAIRNSIINGFEGFYLYFQPIVDAADEKLIGAEALLRWKNEEFGEVPPGVFIPWLENDPFFWELGNWILKQALTEVKPLLQIYPDFLLNVNLAYPQMSHIGFCETVKEILEKTEFPAEHLCLELTERCRQLEKKNLQEITGYLKNIGIKIAIDDFGTGFSTLNLLSELTIDTLKIDRGFIQDIESNMANQAIVEAVTGCANKLDVHVCMEGIETRQMIDFVKKYDIYSFQGYHFSKPISMEQFMDKYAAGNRE